MESHEISAIEQELLNVAVAAIEAVHKGEVLAMVMQDAHGVFWHLRPGNELAIARHLADGDYKAFVRQVEEHTA